MQTPGTLTRFKWFWFNTSRPIGCLFTARSGAVAIRGREDCSSHKSSIHPVYQSAYQTKCTFESVLFNTEWALCVSTFIVTTKGNSAHSMFTYVLWIVFPKGWDWCWISRVLYADENFCFRLKMYVHATFDHVKVFMKAEGRKANSVRWDLLSTRHLSHFSFSLSCHFTLIPRRSNILCSSLWDYAVQGQNIPLDPARLNHLVVFSSHVRKLSNASKENHLSVKTTTYLWFFSVHTQNLSKATQKIQDSRCFVVQLSHIYTWMAESFTLKVLFLSQIKYLRERNRWNRIENRYLSTNKKYEDLTKNGNIDIQSIKKTKAANLALLNTPGSSVM